MAEITLRIEGGDRLARGLAEAPRVVEVELRDAMETSLLYVESDARRLAPRDTGRLGGSINSRIEGGAGSGLVGRVGPSVNYGLFVERGRRPGRMPPAAAVAAWARRKGLGAYAVARAIGRKGTRAQPFMGPALEANVGRIEARFRRAGANIVARLVGQGRAAD